MALKGQATVPMTRGRNVAFTLGDAEIELVHAGQDAKGNTLVELRSSKKIKGLRQTMDLPMEEAAVVLPASAVVEPPPVIQTGEKRRLG